MRARLDSKAGWPRIRRAAGRVGGRERPCRFRRRAASARHSPSMPDPKEPAAKPVAAKPVAASAEAQPDLVERARRGDKAAFGQLVRLNQRRVYACAVHMLGDRGEAED